MKRRGRFLCLWFDVMYLQNVALSMVYWYDTANSFCVKSHFDGTLVRVSHVFNSFFLCLIQKKSYLKIVFCYKNVCCIGMSRFFFLNHDNDFKHFRHNSIFFFSSFFFFGFFSVFFLS